MRTSNGTVRVARAVAVGASVLIVAAACDQDVTATKPLDRASPEYAEQAGTTADAPFYYFHHKKIYLALDSTRLVIGAPNGDQVRQALASQGITADSVAPTVGVPNYWVVRLAGQPTAARSLRARIKQAGRFPFVAFAYTTRDGHAPILLVNRVIVQFRASTSRSQIDSLAAAVGMHIERRAHPDSGLTTYWLMYPDSATDPLHIAALLDQHPLVTWADPDRLATVHAASVPSDPYFSQQVYLTNSAMLNGVQVDDNIEAAWDLTKGSSNIRVAVVDEGIDGQHSEFAGRLDAGYDLFAGQGFPDDEYDPNSNDNHGTEVAGIIGAAHDGVGIAGIAPNVHLVSVRILRFQTNETDAQVADALTWAYQHADVLNNSWGSADYDQAIDAAIYNGSYQGRGGLGATFVFAAGNDAHNDSGQPHGLSAEASSNTALPVGAIDANGLLADYTNTGLGSQGLVAISGHSANVVCSGTPHILTTDLSGSLGCNGGPSSNQNYTFSFNGTSAAAPQVSGVAALLLSLEPQLTSSQVRTRILNNADVWGGSRPSSLYGEGKLNAYRALTNAGALTATVSGPTYIDQAGNYSWTAHPSGGDGTYSYQWQESFNSGQSWTNVGSGGQMYSEYEGSSDNFELRVLVTSGTQNATSTALHITVSIGGCGPSGC